MIKRDLSSRNELVGVRPDIVLLTQIPSFKRLSAEARLFGVARLGKGMEYLEYLMRFIRRVYGSVSPSISMMLLLVRGVVLKELKVFYSIICLYSVLVMYTLSPCKFSAKSLLHYKAVLKNPFAVHVYSEVAIWCQAWFSSFKITPVCGYVIGAVAMESTPVLLAYSSSSGVKNSSASRYFTYFSFSHGNIITWRDM